MAVVVEAVQCQDHAMRGQVLRRAPMAQRQFAAVGGDETIVGERRAGETFGGETGAGRRQRRRTGGQGDQEQEQKAEPASAAKRSEERRVGTASVSTCSARWWR